MPASYALDPDRALAAVALDGPVRGADLVQAVRALQAGPRWRPGLDTVWDGRALTALDLDPSEFAAVADLRFGPFGSGAPAGRAVMVFRREPDEEVALLFRALARQRGKEAHVVRTLAEALALVGAEGSAWNALEWVTVGPTGGAQRPPRGASLPPPALGPLSLPPEGEGRGERGEGQEEDQG